MINKFFYFSLGFLCACLVVVFVNAQEIEIDQIIIENKPKENSDLPAEFRPIDIDKEKQKKHPEVIELRNLNGQFQLNFLLMEHDEKNQEKYKEKLKTILDKMEKNIEILNEKIIAI